MMFPFCWLVATWIFRLLSHKYPFRNYRNSFSTAKWSFPKYWTKKKPKNLSLFKSKYNVSSSITAIPKIFVNQRSYFATGISRASTETQSIGIHDVHLFNTELAMHCWAIFKYGCFQLFCELRETLLPCFGPYFSC